MGEKELQNGWLKSLNMKRFYKRNLMNNDQEERKKDEGWRLILKGTRFLESKLAKELEKSKAFQARQLFLQTFSLSTKPTSLVYSTLSFALGHLKFWLCNYKPPKIQLIFFNNSILQICAHLHKHISHKPGHILCVNMCSVLFPKVGKSDWKIKSFNLDVYYKFFLFQPIKLFTGQLRPKSPEIYAIQI